jgi:hypothetical protein
VESALLYITDSVLASLDKGCGVVMVLVDLSVAFDTIDQSTLMNTLATHFGIAGTVYEWIHSYLDIISRSLKVIDLISHLTRVIMKL